MLALSTSSRAPGVADASRAGRSAGRAKDGNVSPAMLTNMISDASTPKEVFEMMELYGGDFNDIHCSACLRRLAVMKARFTQEMANSKLFEDFMYVLAEHHAGFMNPFGLSITAWSLGMLSKTSSIDYGGVIESVARHATATIDEFPEESISNLAWGLGQLRHKDAALMEAVARRTCKIRRSLKPEAIVSVAWSFAELQLHDEELMQVLAQQATKGMGQWNLRRMASFASCFTRLNQTHKGLIQAMTNTAMRLSWKDGGQAWFHRAQLLLASARAEVRDEELLDRFDRHLDEQALADVSEYSVAAMLWACRELGCRRGHPKLFARLQDAADRKGLSWASIEDESLLDPIQWNSIVLGKSSPH